MTDRAYIISRTLENKIAIAENNEQNTLLVTLDVLKEILALLKEQEAVVHCGDCENFCFDNISPNAGRCMLTNKSHSKTWFCAHGKREKGTENDSL